MSFYLWFFYIYIFIFIFIIMTYNPQMLHHTTKQPINESYNQTLHLACLLLFYDCTHDDVSVCSTDVISVPTYYGLIILLYLYYI